MREVFNPGQGLCNQKPVSLNATDPKLKERKDTKYLQIFFEFLRNFM